MDNLSSVALVALYVFIKHMQKLYGVDKGTPFALRQWNLFTTGERGMKLSDEAVILIDKLGMNWNEPSMCVDIQDWMRTNGLIHDEMGTRNLFGNIKQ